MPSNVDGDLGYGSVAASQGPGLAGSLVVSETVPLLIPESEPEPRKWAPLTKEQLEREAGGPRWRKIRSRLVLFFWICWLSMLGASIAIIVQSPRPVAPTLLWWQKALFYRLQPALFMDAETQGAGVIAVSEHLPYLQSLGVGALVLEGLFSNAVSPPDLSLVDPSVGTTPQIQHLLMESHKAGLKVVLDWCDLDLPAPEALVNNSNVQKAIRYWLDQGVAGFGICDTDTAYSQKVLMKRFLLEEFSTQDDERIVMVTQKGDVPNTSSSSLNTSMVELVTRSLLPQAHHLLSTQEVAIAVETLLDTPMGDAWPSWTLGEELAWRLQRVLMVLMMTLPGSPVVKYGEEINPTQNVSLGLVQGQHADVQMDEGKRRRSEVSLFTSLSHYRGREEALLFGSLSFLSFNSTSLSSSSSNSSSFPSSFSPPILAFLRSWGCVHVLVVVNLGSETHALDPAWAPSLPSAGVFMTSTGMNRLGAISLDALKLGPQEGIVIKLFQTGSYSP
ncbi:amino acid transporter heavy chain SLC3A2 isoform X2 [Osmerus mordax]|uniref:amino acid transporter heavy chain SLC3A2 isoform X2 n=1 Tax=Osmerus mordax TaxID=8014 RepID=UPI00350F812F